MSVQKSITGRELRRSTPEEKLTPGEALVIRKQGGKVFELRRLDGGTRSLVKELDHLLKEVPNSGKAVRTDLARAVTEERE